MLRQPDYAQYSSTPLPRANRRTSPLGSIVGRVNPLFIWVLLLAADAVTTQIALSFGAVEANPLLSMSALHIGMSGTLLVKSAGGILLGAFLWKFGHRGLLKPLNVGLSAVALFNVVVILAVM